MDKNSVSKIILEVRAGTGGDEASLFAADLVRMYQKYGVKQGWTFTVLDESLNESGGYKTFVAEVKGTNVYDELRQESGVHRVQRVPATESKGRVHTSTASVAILPAVSSQEVEIKESDLEVSFFRSSGPGGQNVNKVETAVRLRHIPTDTVVSCQTGRSQHANREQAMAILRSRIFERKRAEEEVRLGGLRKNQIGTGDRSEKIRTYNFPRDRITDHRIGKKWGNIEVIMDGGFGKIARAFPDSGYES